MLFYLSNISFFHYNAHFSYRKCELVSKRNYRPLLYKICYKWLVPTKTWLLGPVSQHFISLLVLNASRKNKTTSWKINYCRIEIIPTVPELFSSINKVLKFWRTKPSFKSELFVLPNKIDSNQKTLFLWLVIGAKKLLYRNPILKKFSQQKCSQQIYFSTYINESL